MQKWFLVFFAVWYFAHGGCAAAKDFAEYEAELRGKRAIAIAEVPVREYPPRGIFLQAGDKMDRTTVGEPVVIDQVNTYVGVTVTDIWVRIKRVGKKHDGWCLFGRDGQDPSMNFEVRDGH